MDDSEYVWVVTLTLPEDDGEISVWSEGPNAAIGTATDFMDRLRSHDAKAIKIEMKTKEEMHRGLVS